MSGDPRMRVRALGSLGAALLFAALVRAPIADIPLERDEGEYAYVGERWLNGEIPYRDAFDQKPPGIFLVYGGVIRALGRSPSAIHWGAQIWSFGTVAAVWALARAAAGNAAGAAAGIIFSLLSADPGVLGNAANTETFLVLPSTLSLLAALRARRSGNARWALAAGLLAGAATLFKQVAMTNALLAAAVIAWPRASDRTRWGRPAADLALFALGGLLAWLPFVAWFAGAGAFHEFWDSVAGYNLGYASSVPLKYYLRNLRWTFGVILALAWPAYLLAVVGLSAWIAKAECRGQARLLGAWLAASAAGVAIGGYFRDHYYIQALPAVSVFAALGVRAVSDLVPGRGRGAAFAAVLAVPLYYTVSVSSWYYLPGDAKAKSCELYPANPFAISEEVGRFIAERTRPDDRVFILGSEPQVLFHAGRRSATRYIYVYPLMVPTETARQRQAELLAEVARASPRVVVTVFAPTSFLAGKGTATEIFGETRRMLAGYRLVALALYGKDDSSRFVTGAEARAAWARSPMWYDRPIVGSLAVWEKP